MTSEQIQDVAVTEIELVPLLRKSIDQEKLAGLMQSIQEVGLLYPPRLTRRGEKYVPADGYHRILALMKLGRKSIPAIIEEKPLAEGEMLRKGLIANSHRVDNTPLEKAEGIARLMEVTGWNASTVADKLGFSNATVSRLLALLQLPEPIRERVHRGEIPPSAAYELARAKDSDTRASLASQVVSGTLTRDGLAGTIRSQRNGKGTPRAARAGSAASCLRAARSRPAASRSTWRSSSRPWRRSSPRRASPAPRASRCPRWPRCSATRPGHERSRPYFYCHS